MHQLFQGAKIANAINPLSQTGDAAIVGAIIDRLGYSGPVTFVVTTGTLVTAGGAFTPSLDAGDDSGLSGSETPTAAQMEGTLAAATFAGTDDNKVFHIGYTGPRRYVRLTLTPAGNVGAAALGALAVLQKPNFGGATMP